MYNTNDSFCTVASQSAIVSLKALAAEMRESNPLSPVIPVQPGGKTQYNRDEISKV